MRGEVKKLTLKKDGLLYLSNTAIIPLTKTCALVGRDGWGGGRAGSFYESQLVPNDFRFIKELAVPTYLLFTDQTKEKN